VLRPARRWALAHWRDTPSPDREITLEAVYCLGNCACGPSVRVDDRVLGRVTPEAFDALVDELGTQPLEVIG